MAAKTPNALLHGTLDALILKTLASGPRRYAIAKFIEDASSETVVVEEVALSGALPHGAARLARSRVGRVGAGASSQTLSPHSAGAQTAHC